MKLYNMKRRDKLNKLLLKLFLKHFNILFLKHFNIVLKSDL